MTGRPVYTMSNHVPRYFNGKVLRKTAFFVEIRPHRFLRIYDSWPFIIQMALYFI